MVKSLFTTALLSCMVLAAFPSISFAARIIGPEIRIINNDILITTGLADYQEIEDSINSGIEKEIVFTVELFRSWKFWPDEFVVSRRIERVIKHDRLRDQYLTISTSGKAQSEKKFRDYDEMRSWTFTFRDINLANTRELEAGTYYVRVVAESRSRELPPIIGLLMFFIPEVEMSLAIESHPITIGGRR